jgi:YD repeat-containing protein
MGRQGCSLLPASAGAVPLPGQVPRRTVRRALEPDGRQYWFNQAGRLIKLYDRYEKNALELSYNAKGDLAQIKDELGREIDIGYWRLPNDNDPPQRPTVDRTTDNPLIAGKICRLKDYSDRDILFYYTDEGLLERREGPQVTTAMSPRGFTGRQKTYYAYSGTGDPARTAQSLIAVTSGDPSGAPFVSVAQYGAHGRDTVPGTSPGRRPRNRRLGYDNTARALSAGNQLATITTPDGSTTEYTFDQVGHPGKIRLSGALAESEETATTYFPNGLVESITGPEGNRTEYTYDSASQHLRSRGNIVRIRKLPGPRGGPDLEVTTAYDSRYNLPAGPNKDYNGEVAQITLFSDGRDTQSVTKGGDTETYAVNEFGQITRHTAYDGVVRTWDFYPNTGFLKSQGVGDLETTFLYLSGFSQRGLPSASIDPQTVMTTFTYDERNQLIESSRAGVDTRFAYDESGNCIVVDAAVDNGRRLVEDRYYNQVGFLTRQAVRNVEVDGVPRDLIAEFEPDALNRVRVALFNGSDRHELTYDHLGRVVRYQVPAAGYDEQRTYDRNGNHRTTTIGNGTEEYIYDGHDRLIQVITPRETRIDLTLDGNNNLRKKKITDQQGVVLFECDYDVDALNRYTHVTRYRDGGSPVTVRYGYSTAERSITFTDGMGAGHKTLYDTAGRVYREELPTKTIGLDYFPNGNLRTKSSTENGRTFTESFAYDSRENLESITDSVGQTTSFVCGFDGRVLEVRDREGHIRSHAYTLLGELASTTDPNNVLLAHGYDVNRQLSSLRDTADNRMENHYDTAGRLTDSTLPNSASTAYSSFDPLNLPQAIAFPRGVNMALSYHADGTPVSRNVSGAGAARQETFRYDGLRRLVFLSDPSGTMERVYDKFGFIKEFKWTHSSIGLGYSVSQDADDGGFRTKVVYPADNLEVTNGRDLTGRLLTLRPASGEPVVQDTTYATDRRIGERILGDQRLRLRVEYDGLKRAVARRYVRASDGQPLVDVRYAMTRTVRSWPANSSTGPAARTSSTMMPAIA